ncbi:MAG: hypothetical protein A3D92_23375 [Bacteroidetes bacterium RIFCSPHIGHO2_02_FULL_44_7]|nr:MAG: hypothetical protein A3D92_23375 [Bacteroidetes bacterium RIFCSPHIGHO2_02_FULL_44_7]
MEKVGLRVEPFVIVADGPEILVQFWLIIVPSESVAEALVGAEVVVGKVIVLSVPAYTEGGMFGAAETTTCISSVSVSAGLPLSVTVNWKTYVPTLLMFENVGFKVFPFVIVADGPEILVQTVLEIVPSESVADVPVGAEEEVGKVMNLSGPA